MAKIFVSGPNGDRRDVDLLTERGFEVSCGPGAEERPEYRFGEEEWRGRLGDADVVLIASRDRMTGPDFHYARRLRAVVKASIGVERVDVAAATKAGVLVVNSPSRENYIGVAEAVVGLMLAHGKQLYRVQDRLRQGGWKSRETRGDLLAGSTLGLVGFGRIGSAVAQRLAAWEMEILAHDPYRDPADMAEHGARAVPLTELLERADIVSLHVVLTEETRGLIGRTQLASMRPDALLINTARGEVVDEAALAEALEAGRPGRAALDVFATEPLPADSPLRRFAADRLILTPHTIGNSHASGAAGARMAVDSITALMASEVPEHVLNPAAIPAWRRRFASPVGSPG